MAIIFRDRNQPHDAGEEATWVISGTSSVMYVKGVNEFPVNSSVADTNAAGVDYLRELGHQTVRKVRELLPHGTLNNVMRRGKYRTASDSVRNHVRRSQHHPGRGLCRDQGEPHSRGRACVGPRGQPPTVCARRPRQALCRP